MADLSSCPFCGGPASSGEGLSEHQGKYFIQTGCCECGALGPRVEVPTPETRPAHQGLQNMNDWARNIRISTPAADAAWNCRKQLH
jgi:hypothetical protein